MSQRKLKVAVDVDRTLFRYTRSDMARDNVFGEPFPGAKKALEEMRAKGYEIILYTCRMNPEVCGNQQDVVCKALEEHMQEHGMPYDEIYAGPGKVIADAYIDDKAVPCVPEINDRYGRDGSQWREAMEMLETVLDDERDRQEAKGPQPVKCPTCYGNGYHWQKVKNLGTLEYTDAYVECPQCKGTKRIMR